MHSHCELCTVTVPEKSFWINFEVKGVVRWDSPACQLVAVEADFLVVFPIYPAFSQENIIHDWNLNARWYSSRGIVRSLLKSPRYRSCPRHARERWHKVSDEFGVNITVTKHIGSGYLQLSTFPDWVSQLRTRYFFWNYFNHSHLLTVWFDWEVVAVCPQISSWLWPTWTLACVRRLTSRGLDIVCRLNLITIYQLQQFFLGPSFRSISELLSKTTSPYINVLSWLRPWSYLYLVLLFISVDLVSRSNIYRPTSTCWFLCFSFLYRPRSDPPESSITVGYIGKIFRVLPPSATISRGMDNQNGPPPCGEPRFLSLTDRE
jgi:hypothetical protein